MLRDKLAKLAKLGKNVKTNNRKLATSLDPYSNPFWQTKRFFANNQEEQDFLFENVVDDVDKVPVSLERDKVFTEKKMTMWDHIKVAAHHVKKGFQTVGQDSVYLVKLLNKKQFREESYTVFELRERRRISKDLIKFIPYSCFMAIPFMEAFLPIYMVLFPNSMPTQFMFESQVGKKTSELVEAQEDAYEKIIPLLPKFANVIGLDPLKFVQSIYDILEREGKAKDRLFYKVSDFESKISQFVKDYQKMSKEELDFHSMNHMTSYELEQTAKLLSLDYIPGYNLLNNIMWTFTRLPFVTFNFMAQQLYKLRLKRNKKAEPWAPIDYMNFPISRFEFRFDMGPMSYVKKILLTYQIKFHLSHIKRQDIQLARDLDQLDKLPLSHLASMARQRGINLDKDEDIKIFLKKYWLPLSVKANLDGDSLVWISFMRYSYNEVLV